MKSIIVMDKQQVIEKTQPLQKNIQAKNLRSLNHHRAPSRQFNNPIYAGFDMDNDDNKQLANWGPWVDYHRSELKNSRSMHSTFKNFKRFEVPSFHEKMMKQKSVQIKPEIQIAKKQLSPFLKNDLPQIKEKFQLTFRHSQAKAPLLKQYRAGSLDFVSQSLQKEKREHKIKFQIRLPNKSNYLRREPTLAKKNLDLGAKALKLGNVVYNYCTENNIDECLLNYHRILMMKEQEQLHLKRDEQDQNRNREKSYWKKRFGAESMALK